MCRLRANISSAHRTSRQISIHGTDHKCAQGPRGRRFLLRNPDTHGFTQREQCSGSEDEPQETGSTHTNEESICAVEVK
jgi:hypothetical protein